MSDRIDSSSDIPEAFYMLCDRDLYIQYRYKRQPEMFLADSVHKFSHAFTHCIITVTYYRGLFAKFEMKSEL